MSKYFEEPEATIYHGNCLEELKNLADNSVDAIVTDPPYGLGDSDPDYILNALKMWIGGDREHIPAGKGFMGKQWDAFVPPSAVWDECFRVLKPGGHILVFAGTRTQDLMGLSVRMAGFEIRDSIAWIYGQGFPKSLDISKQLDKMAGAEREVIGSAGNAPDLRDVGAKSKEAIGIDKLSFGQVQDAERTEILITAPSTDDAKKWSGWGTALKPALEPIIVGRKPLSEKNVASNVLKWGTGGINIDGSRIGTEQRTDTITENGFGNNFMDDGWVPSGKTYEKTVTGRFPSNVILQHSDGCTPTGQVITGKTSAGNRTATFGTQETVSGGDGSGGFDGYEYKIEVYQCVDGCPIKELNEQSGVTKSGQPREDRGTGGIWSEGNGVPVGQQYGDAGGASRFFHQTTPDEEPIGRFPSNVIFGHTEECVEVGVVEEKYSINKTEDWTGFGQTERPDYVGEDKVVSTSVWECADGCPIKELDEQTQGKITQGHWAQTKVSGYGEFGSGSAEYLGVGRKAEEKSGGASRFFYQAKANKKDRNEGLGEDLPEKGKVYNGKSADSAGNAPGSVEDKFTTQPAKNFHPTVKPTALMEYLVKLVTPKGGIVLDPFSGSGSTGKAAVRNGFKFIGVEITEEYLPILKARVEFEINNKRSSLF